MEEKSSFLATCNLLSQFLKKKGSLSDLIAARASESDGKSRPPITMSLLPALEASKDDGSDTNKNPQQEETNTDIMDLFPASPVLNSTEIGKENREQQKAQLTIFYGGRVLVFDDFPADKAKDLMEMAGKTSTAAKDFALALPSTSAAEVQMAADGPSTSRGGGGGESQDGSANDEQHKPAQVNSSNMRVARRASLHKFLEKRKDRITAKAPYQLDEPPAPQAQKFDDTCPWLGFGESSKPSSSNDRTQQDKE